MKNSTACVPRLELLDRPHALPPKARPHSRVLLAEDDADLRQLMAAALRADGHQVIEAPDGDRLLMHIEQQIAGTRRDNFAVVVSDVRMPGLWGTDVLAVLSCSKWTTPFVLMTAFGDAELHAQAREMGATAVLDKPVDLDALRSVVWWAMDAR